MKWNRVMEEPFIDAMRALRVLEFEYKNHRRIVHPHALFRRRDSDETLLLGWQTGGSSSTGEPPCWRNFDLSKVADLTVQDETFAGPQADFNRARFRAQTLIHSL
jgi:hypothetical protein